MGCINPFTTVCRWFGGCRPEDPRPPEERNKRDHFPKVDRTSHPGWDWSHVDETVAGHTQAYTDFDTPEPDARIEQIRADLNGDGFIEAVTLENNYAYDLRDPKQIRGGRYDSLSVVDGRSGRRFKVNLFFMEGHVNDLGRWMHGLKVLKIDDDENPDIAVKEINRQTGKEETVVYLNKMPQTDPPDGTPYQAITSDPSQAIVELFPGHNKSHRIRNIVFTGTNLESEGGRKPLTADDFKKWALKMADGLFATEPYIGRRDDFNLWFVAEPVAEPRKHELAAFASDAYDRNELAYERYFRPAGLDTPLFAGQTVYWQNILNGDCRSQGIAVSLSSFVQDPKNFRDDDDLLARRFAEALINAAGEEIGHLTPEAIGELAYGNDETAARKLLERVAEAALVRTLIIFVAPTQNRKAFTCIEKGDPRITVAVANHEFAHLDGENDEYREAGFADDPVARKIVDFAVTPQTILLTPLRERLRIPLPSSVTIRPIREIVSPTVWQRVLGKPDPLFPNAAPDEETARASWGPFMGVGEEPFRVGLGHRGSMYSDARGPFLRPSEKSMMLNSRDPEARPNAVHKAMTRGLWLLPYLE